MSEYYYVTFFFSGNLFNWALAGVQLNLFMFNFGTYFLAVFMVNLCLYLMFYIVMKYLSGERLVLPAALYLLAACSLWAAALYFFFHKAISWEVSLLPIHLIFKRTSTLVFALLVLWFRISAGNQTSVGSMAIVV